MLDLLLKGDFPKIHRPSAQSIEILRMLRYRHRMVKMRTMIVNNLQALAIGSGLSLQSRLLTRPGRLRLLAAQMSPVMGRQREEWLSLLDNLNARIASVVKWLEQQAQTDSKVQLLRTHPGLGLLTAIGLVHSMEPVTRFSNQRKVRLILEWNRWNVLLLKRSITSESAKPARAWLGSCSSRLLKRLPETIRS
jgi:transposase